MAVQYVLSWLGEYPGDKEMNGETLCFPRSLLQWVQYLTFPFPTGTILYTSYGLYGLVTCHFNFPPSLREIKTFSGTFSSSRFFHLLCWLRFSLTETTSFQIITFEDIWDFLYVENFITVSTLLKNKKFTDNITSTIMMNRLRSYSCHILLKNDGQLRILPLLIGYKGIQGSLAVLKRLQLPHGLGRWRNRILLNIH